MDDFQVSKMVDYMLGDRNVGGSHDDPAGTPHSPELRAFIVGRLGSLTLDGGWGLRFPRSEKPKAAALAALLREVADAIDPPASDAEAA